MNFWDGRGNKSDSHGPVVTVSNPTFQNLVCFSRTLSRRVAVEKPFAVVDVPSETPIP